MREQALRITAAFDLGSPLAEAVDEDRAVDQAPVVELAQCRDMVDRDESVIARQRGAIGYIPMSAADGTVKVVAKVNGKAVSAPDYPYEAP